jgi:glycosyltransferase involved in cell wall biosynthesis
VRRLGLAETARFTGYLGGEEYVGALRALDLSIFLVPGSDGTCRAVREALAMGLPVVAARRGILPELVKDQETGLLIEDTPENLAAALIELGRDRARLGEMSAAARRDAEARFSYGAHATALESVYRSVVAER